MKFVIDFLKRLHASNYIETTILISLLFTLIHGHGRLMQPAGRSSLWRFPEFSKFKPLKNWDDNQLYCGGFNVQYYQNGGKCGVCGDPWHQPEPRDNEDGGIYGKGIIAAHYRPGEIIKVVVEMTLSHLGYFRLRLCPRNDTSPVTQACFNKNKLYFTDDSGRKLGTVYFVDKIGFYNATMILPNIVGSRSVIQWHYRTGNTWGTCKNGTTHLGCGKQETFRSCADVSIV